VRVTYVKYVSAHLAEAVSTVRQARGYPPSRRSSPLFGRYQFMLLGEQKQHTYENNLLLSESGTVED